MAFRWNTTRWSIIRAAGRQDGRQAMSVLWGSYWRPVHAFMCAHGLARDEAEDVTQSFLAGLERTDLAAVQPERGRFRGWLRACARNFLFNYKAHARTLKAGGAVRFASIEEEAAALPFDQAPPPDRQFDRAWALDVVARALTRLHDQYASEGRADVFARLRATLSGDGEARGGRTADAIRARHSREKKEMRVRYARCLCAEVAGTVTDPEAIGDEIRELFDALS